MSVGLQGFESDESSNNIAGTLDKEFQKGVVRLMRRTGRGFVEPRVGASVGGGRVRSASGVGARIRFVAGFEASG